MENKSFARTVKTMRENKGLSLEDVRRRSHSTTPLALSYINRIENGAVPPSVISIGTLLKLAKGLDEPVQKMFDLAIDNKVELAPNVADLVHIADKLQPGRLVDLIRIGEVFARDGGARTSGEMPMGTLKLENGGEKKRRIS
jgi:transcriptional regulator with XRE-family HTH domain